MTGREFQRHSPATEKLPSPRRVRFFVAHVKTSADRSDQRLMSGLWSLVKSYRKGDQHHPVGKDFSYFACNFCRVCVSDPRQLSYPTRLLLRPTVLRGGTSSRVQALLAYTGQEITTSFSVFSMWLYVCLSLSVCTCVQSVQDFSVVFVNDGQTMTYGPCVAHEQSQHMPEWGPIPGEAHPKHPFEWENILCPFPASSLSTSVQPQ